MDIKPHELSENGYQRMAELSHQDILPFVRQCLSYRTRAVRIYWGANGASLLFLAAAVWWNVDHGVLDLGDSLSYVSFGILLAFCMIPLHEYIHVLAYRYVGARQTSYDMNLKKFYFMAMADQFVADAREFRIVALAPVVSISILLLTAAVFVPAAWIISVMAALLTHTAFCSGDFGLLSYFEQHADLEVVTYDDKTGGTTYFYGKSKP